MLFHAEQNAKGTEKDARCPNKWRASSAKAGKSNSIDQTSIEIIVKEARGEKKSVRGGSVEKELRGRVGRRLSSFDDIYSEARRYSAFFFLLLMS